MFLKKIGVTDLERGVRYASLAERRDDVHAEERHPAQEERAHDDAHGDGGLVVAHVVRRRVVVDGGERGRRGRGGRGGRGGRRVRGQRPGDGPDALDVLLRVAVQPAVDADHDHARYVEADARRDHRVRGCQVQGARHVLRVAGVKHHRFRGPANEVMTMLGDFCSWLAAESKWKKQMARRCFL